MGYTNDHYEHTFSCHSHWVHSKTWDLGAFIHIDAFYTYYGGLCILYIFIYKFMHVRHIMEKKAPSSHRYWHCLVLNIGSSCGVFLGSRDGHSWQKPLGSRHCKTNSCSPWWACSVCLINHRISRLPLYILIKEFFHLWVIRTCG